MNNYWLSMIVRFNERDKPRLISVPCHSLEEAKKEIEKRRMRYDVYAAWVDADKNNNEHKIVYHACYVDSLGHIVKM